jgi:GSH-dependent disulfide-bond oxidoreductase
MWWIVGISQHYWRVNPRRRKAKIQFRPVRESDVIDSRQDPKLKLYSGPTPNGRKIGIMLEECGFEYESTFIDILAGDQLSPEFLALNPNNKHPVLVDRDGPDGRTVTVWESGAILVYLAEKTGRYLPHDPVSRIEALQWLFFQVANQGPAAGQLAHFAFYARPENQLPYAIERFRNEVGRQLAVMDAHLAGREYFAGEYSIADMALLPYTAASLARPQAELPNVRRWCAALMARKAVQRGMKLFEDRVQAATIAGGLQGFTDEHRSVLFGDRQYRRAP